LAVEACVEALNPNKFGRLVSFSPCIEQVQQMVQTLDKNGFISIETIEIVPRKLKVCLELKLRGGSGFNWD